MDEGEAVLHSEPVVFNSYELCKFAEQFVNGKGKPDYSVKELFYVDNDMGAGFAQVFVSHYQADPITKTITAMETFEKTRFGLFSIRQGAKSDVKLDYVKELITKIGLALMVVEPWAELDTTKRICCVRNPVHG